MTPADESFAVPTLGERRAPSPLGARAFTPDSSRVLVDIDFVEGEQPSPKAFEKAGPREKVYFDPRKCTAAIVTCGGLCPGLNNVVRNLYYTLHDAYGVPSVLGVRYGFRGMVAGASPPPIELTRDSVESIHHQGGTILGTSRGPQEPAAMVDFLLERGVNLFFPIGGDGTQRGAHAIATEARRRGAELAVVGIPKTIDNDIRYCFMTFGYMSAVAEAERVIDRAHIEAKSVSRGVGLVKLMGREAGFLAAAATIASGEVNFALIPESPFKLDGEAGFLAKLGRRLDARDHAVVVVAEGAGQDLLKSDPKNFDASGNRVLGDIGQYLRDRIESHFREAGRPVSMKYFDPSYYLRSVQASASDSLLTERFARHAAHAAMAGKTDLLVAYWNGRIVHVPLAASVGRPSRVGVDSELWAAVRAITRQDCW
jgi:6-phosphofructokinase 1